ncbi:TIGR02680 family protein [Pseudonocardia ammonioxydans]|uniref:TIGR02680 family protein n=1 Tax=Pseudonocardia ammonioxydans TaxID=260086 RepID=A0A1I4UHA8_PSUAM|nr:TIGR02680 family protein [Pseudonocardia ammonioxydans]SFM88315.1 TIGR02680 family protein [Pseudonocardia ammonioxydans]
MTEERFRFARAGVLNVWQYDDQIFEFAGGRMLLRGSNGAGKSKTLEMLLPFVLDGDKARMTASARHHTSLLWLMLDGYEGQNRAGYLWLELARPGETVICGVGIRASQSARAASAWFFTCPGTVGEDLLLEDDAGPLAKDRLRAAVEAAGGQFFDSARSYKQHVGRLLFGLDPDRYDELLRLLYWLRQPQVGEDIEPARLAEQLIQALPQLDDDAVRAAGDTFDELAAFGEQLDRQRRSAEGVSAFAEVYAAYAREELRTRGADLVEQHTERTRRHREVERCAARSAEVARRLETTTGERDDTGTARATLATRLEQLRRDPLLRNERELERLQERAADLRRASTAAERVRVDAERRAAQTADRARSDGVSLVADLDRFAATAHEHAAGLGRAGVHTPLPVPAVLRAPALATTGDAPPVAEALTAHSAAVTAARPVLGQRRAAVDLVAEARAALDTAIAGRHREEETAAAAEQRAEEARGYRADAGRAADVAEREFTGALDAWRADIRAVPVDVPAELDADAVAGLGARARSAAQLEVDRHRGQEKDAGALRASLDRELTTTRALRDQVAAEADPAPPAPAWRRDPRETGDGAPLWQLIDFAGSVGPADRAGIEAALESSGLLDAWVRADGAVLDPDRDDVVLPAGPPAVGTGVGEWLIADPPTGSPVTAAVVAGVLARVAASGPGLPDWVGDVVGRGGPVGADAPADDSGSAPVPAAVVGTDGRWRLGPLTGRSSKPTPQYIGATARAAERRRRLDELDTTITGLEDRRDTAATVERTAAQAARDLEAWLAELPVAAGLLRAWTLLDERNRAVERAERIAADAERAAVDARGKEAARRRELHDLAAVHELPVEAEALAARREALRELDRLLERHATTGTDLDRRLARWADDAGVAEQDRSDAEEAAARAEESERDAVAAEEAARELERTVDAPVRELRARITEAEERDAQLQRRLRELDETIAELHTSTGQAGQAAEDAAARLAEQEPVLAAAVARLASLDETPGLVDSGAEALVELPEGALDLARGFTAGGPVPAAVLVVARRLGELPEPGRAATTVAVFAALQDATSGPAADVDPRVVEIGGALAAIGRDDAGEHAIGVLARRLAAGVERDADLLTERERRLFEEHILGDLGESLRARRQESEELVTAMNSLLRGVTTSQGIAVQLRWTLRDDVSGDARRAVELLGRPVGSLLPDERQELRDALHRLIEASRSEAPEDSYSEHLNRALDYRRWFAFRIRYTRPETPGTWADLHRRSPLSQGEQKVVCYLPLFAAAAAHFSSLAGAAPYSPRFVLLDDAFPKIDVRTHPLLFGLLVQLDLDFVVTSERLWGDHETVPSLAIYEALRDPAERGIAQYRHVWDGRRLQAVGS